MKYIFLLTVTVFILHSAIAQRPALTVKGIVRNTQNYPVVGASVSLFSRQDSTLSQTTLSDSIGKFEFRSQFPDSFFLTITSIGYHKYIGKTMKLDSSISIVELPVIILPATDKYLQEVIVKTKPPLITQSIDRTIINVDALLGTSASNTFEVLEKTPGVTISNDGELSLNGKAGVLVLIDGRSTYISGPGLAAYLKSIPGSTLDKIELISNPPSKYEAMGSAIINIKLKKNKLQGLNGNVSLSYNQGTKFRTNNAVNFNYNNKKVNLFGNIGHARDAGYSDDLFNRTFFDNTNMPRSIVLQSNYNSFRSNSMNTRLGIDYTASAKTTYGFIFNINKKPLRESLNYNINSYNNDSKLDSIGKGNNLNSTDWTNIGGNLNFLHKFNNDGRQLTADLNYINYKTAERESFLKTVYLPGGTTIDNNEFLYNIPSTIKIYNAQIDYTHPHKQDVRLDAGLKSSFVNSNSVFKYYRLVTNRPEPDSNQFNHFIYSELINAAYVTVQKNYKRIGAQFGLRMENTIISGNQVGTSLIMGSKFKRSFTSLFPSFFISYDLDSSKRNTLSLSMSRRIKRPNYQQLNPFLFYRDQYSYFSGNPDVKPQYSYQYELNYQYRQLLRISLQYGNYTDIIFQTTKAENNIFITRPGNVTNGRLISLATNLSLSPAPWWKLNTNVVLIRLSLNGMAGSQKLNPSMYTGRFNLLNQFRLGSKWNGELTAAYFHKDIQGQTIIEPRYRVNAAIQMSILKDKGNIRLSSEDIFHSLIQKDQTISLQQATSLHTGYTDSQRIGIAFTYRFGKQQNNNRRGHKESTAEEKERID